MQNRQLEADLIYTYEQLTENERKKLKDAVILITGGAGFLGFYFMHFFHRFQRELGLKKVICLDNFILGRPKWLDRIGTEEGFEVKSFDISTDAISNIPEANDATHIIHMASIASPMFYRQHPIKTLDANVWGLRSLLDFYKEKQIGGFLFFSSSEIYGDPDPAAIPIRENYNGNVCVTGPRACYDESKRFGDTMCMLFAQQYGMPIGVARPFNNYGPGMKINDQRVPADFAKNVLEGKDLTILSNGSPKRTFCHIADAVAGYLKILLHGKYDFFNIGIETPEITIAELAKHYKSAGQKVFGYEGTVRYAVSEDKEYLTNNPQRRCPCIDKARTVLGYEPKIDVAEGVERFLRFLKDCPMEDLTW